MTGGTFRLMDPSDVLQSVIAAPATLAFFIGAAAVFYGIAAVMLHYHWRQYGLDRPAVRTMKITFHAVAVLLFVVMGAAFIGIIVR